MFWRSGTLLESQEIFGQPMDPGTLQLTLQLVRRSATATTLHIVPGKSRFKVLLDHGSEKVQAWLHAGA